MAAPTASAAATARRSIAAIRRDGQRLAALLDVGDPGRRAAHHRGDDPAAQHEQSEVAEVLGSDGSKTLQIVDARDVFGRGRSSAARIRRRPLPCAPNSGLSTSGPRGASRSTSARARFAPIRPSRSAASAGRRARAGSSSSICRRSARWRARRSRRRTPSAPQRVQDAEPLGDRFEGAGRHRADVHGVRQARSEARQHRARSGSRCRNRTQRDRSARRARRRGERRFHLRARASRADRSTRRTCGCRRDAAIDQAKEASSRS